MAEDKIVLDLRNVPLIALLVILSVFFVLQLQVTIPSPITFGDEAFHTGMARYIAKEKDYPVWITIEGTDTHRDNFAKPPMLQLLEAGFFLIFGFNELIVKFLFPFISLLTALTIYLFMKRLYDEKVGFIAAVIFMAVPSVVTYSVTFYTEGLVTFYFTLAALFFIYSLKTENKKYLVLIGIFTAFAFLTEVSSVNLIIFIALAVLYGLVKDKKIDILRYAAIFGIFILITAGFFVRNLGLYGVPECYLPFTDKIYNKSSCKYKSLLDISEVTTFKYKYEGRTEQVGSEQSVYGMGIINYLDFAYGNIWLVTLGVFGGIIISLYRKDLTSTLLLLIFLTILPYFHFTTPRAEDAARNLLAWSPFFAIFAGVYFGRLFEFIQDYQKYIAVVIILIVIILSYQNLISKTTVMKQVKQFSPAFFEACNWVKNNLPGNAVLSTVWVHRAAYSCERVTVGNHPDIFISKDIDLIKQTAKTIGVTHLFIQKFSLSTRPLSEVYTIDSVQFFENNTNHFKKVYENGTPIEQCIQQGGCDGTLIYEIL